MQLLKIGWLLSCKSHLEKPKPEAGATSGGTYAEACNCYRRRHSVIVIALLALPHIIDVNQYRGQIQAELQQRLNRPVQLVSSR